MDNIQYSSIACNRINFQVALMNSAFRLTFTDQQSMLSDFQSLSQSQKPKTVLRLIQRAGIIDLVVLKMPQSFRQLNNCTNNYKIITSSVFSSLRQTSQLYQLFLWHDFEIVPHLAFPSLNIFHLSGDISRICEYSSWGLTSYDQEPHLCGSILCISVITSKGHI